MRSTSPGPRVYSALVPDPDGFTGSGKDGCAAGGGSGGREVQPATHATTTNQHVNVVTSACTRPANRCACQPWSLPDDFIRPLPSTRDASSLVAVFRSPGPTSSATERQALAISIPSNTLSRAVAQSTPKVVAYRKRTW